MKHQTRLEQLREECGLSKAALARTAEMQPGTISWIESGRFKPYKSQLRKLASALGWEGEPEELMEEVEER